MTLDSPDALAGPVGAAGLAGPFAAVLALFLIPPTGPVGAALLATRRPPRPRPRPRLLRVVLMISSRPWSSLEDILADALWMNCLIGLMIGPWFVAGAMTCRQEILLSRSRAVVSMPSEIIWLNLRSAKECLARLEMEMMYFRSFRTVAVGS